LARALEVAARRRQATPERVTIFTDAQAAPRRMATDKPGPGQKYVIQARKWIAASLEGEQTGNPYRIPVVPSPRATRGWLAMRGKTNGRSWRQRSPMPMGHGVEWLGYSDRYMRRADATTQIASRHQKGNLREEVGGSQGLEERPDHLKGVWDAEERAVQQDGGGMLQAPGWTILSVEDGSLRHRATPSVDEEPQHYRM